MMGDVSRTDRILEIIDTGLQTARDPDGYVDVAPVITEDCWRCEATEPVTESGLCAVCRDDLLAEREPVPTLDLGRPLREQVGIGRESVEFDRMRRSGEAFMALCVIYECWWGESWAEASARRIREGVEAFREWSARFVEEVVPVFQRITDSFRESLDQLNATLRADFVSMFEESQAKPLMPPPEFRPLGDRPFVPPVWGETPFVFRSIVVDPPYADTRRSGPMATALARRARPFVCHRHGEQPGGFCRRCDRG